MTLRPLTVQDSTAKGKTKQKPKKLDEACLYFDAKDMDKPARHLENITSEDETKAEIFR